MLKEVLQRRKIVQARNLDLHIERKNIQEGINEGTVDP